MSEPKSPRCLELEAQLGAALHGELTAAERAELDAHLAVCPRCAAEAADLQWLWRGLAALPEESPSPFLAARFDRLLRQEQALRAPVAIAGPAAARSRPSAGALAAAAAALLAVGVLFGTSLGGRRTAEVEVAGLRQEVGRLHELVAVSLLTQASPSERLQGVAYGRELAGRDPRVAEALFAALAEDPNVNVRLAALEALAPATMLPAGRARLVRAVARQDSPLVQITAIDLLLESGGEAAHRDLRQLLDSPDLEPAVASYLRDRLGRRT